MFLAISLACTFLCHSRTDATSCGHRVRALEKPVTRVHTTCRELCRSWQDNANRQRSDGFTRPSWASFFAREVIVSDDFLEQRDDSLVQIREPL